MKTFWVIILIIICYNIISSFTLDNTRIKANILIENIEHFKEDTWEYPKNLNNLIPKYLNEIPKNYSSILGDFNYYYSEKNKTYTLNYTYNAPYGKFIYSNDNKKWNNID